MTNSLLHKLSDDLNAVLALADEQFVALKMGVRAEVPLEDGSLLVFMKRDAVWGMHVVESGSSPTPWKNTSRMQRILIAGCLDSLLDKMRANAVLETKRVEDAIIAVDRFLDKFDRPSPSPETSVGAGGIPTATEKG
jgi:hypothetical protein